MTKHPNILSLEAAELLGCVFYVQGWWPDRFKFAPTVDGIVLMRRRPRQEWSVATDFTRSSILLRFHEGHVSTKPWAVIVAHREPRQWTELS